MSHIVDPEPVSPRLIARVLAGEASPEECVAVEQQCAADSGMRAEVELYRQIWRPERGTMPNWDIEQLSDSLRARIAAESTPSIPRTPGAVRSTRRDVVSRTVPQTSTPSLFRWLGVAAGAAILVLAGGPITRTLRVVLRPVEPGNTARVYETNAGQRAQLELADGSQVILAPASTMQVAGRIITLTGEAHFTVRPKTSQPFVVRAAHTETRVLGTTFVVRGYTTDSAVTVVVGDGKVVAGATVLTAGQGTRITNAGSVPLTGAEVAAALGRASNRFVFDRRPVREVLAELERGYAVEFRGLPVEMLGYHITATITGDDLDDQMLETLSAALHATATRAGRVITFHPRSELSR